jgi:hypothetical protein
MIIKLIPETDAEKDRFQEQFGSDKIVHKNVKEYFIFGNKKGNDGLLDWHEWTGSYKYLISNLKYFCEVINDERREHSPDSQPKMRQPLNVSQYMTKEVDTDNDGDGDETINVNAETMDKGFIKHGTVINQNVSPIDVEAIRKPHIVQMRPEDLETIVDGLNKEQDFINDGEGNSGGNIPLPPPPIRFE